MDALVLKATPYRESGKIISLFTKPYGILSAISLRASKKNFSLNTSLSPLSLSQFHLLKGRSDLHKIQDVSLVNAYLPIRNSLSALTAAGSILSSIRKSQFPEKPSPALFQLTTIYLDRLQTSLNPEILDLSFQTKLLRHEGLFPTKREESPIPLSEEEWKNLLALCLSRSFQDIEAIQAEGFILKAVQKLTEYSFNMV